MNALDYQNVWGCILDKLIGDRNRYGSQSTFSFSLDEMPTSVADALKGDDDDLATDAVMIAMALNHSKTRYIIGDPYGMYHYIFIIRLLCKATKAAVDAHNRRHNRYMFGDRNSKSVPMSPWAKWNSWHYLQSYNYCGGEPEINPYRRLIRDKVHEANFQHWNNDLNKHKIRIMWKEYCQKWKPWFTPRRDANNNFLNYRDPCEEERQAYNVFRYYLTKTEFEARWRVRSNCE